MKIITTYNAIFTQTDIPDLTKLIAFSLIYKDYVDSMRAQGLEANEDNFLTFCDGKDQKYTSYLEKAENIFSAKARDYSIDMVTIDSYVEEVLKETGNRLKKIERNTKKESFNGFGWNTISSMLGTAMLFCLLAGLSFLLLSSAEKEDRKPFQHLGIAIDSIMWEDEPKQKNE